MDAPAIVAKGITKTFPFVVSDYGLKDILLHAVSYWKRRRQCPTFTALEDVSFQVYPGTALAVLGANGAGKSTLLSILSGVIPPTAGTAKLSGRVGLMLELGSGFCHDLTGRENIILNGLLLGASRKELEEHIEEIIDFSGVRQFIDTPLKNYSTGMQTRLGFSIAIHTRPDVMLVDEVLAVGDSEFRRKCLERITAMKRQGTAFLLVTHNLKDAAKFCEQAIYLDHGKVRFAGPTMDVIHEIKGNNCEY